MEMRSGSPDSAIDPCSKQIPPNIAMHCAAAAWAVMAKLYRGKCVRFMQKASCARAEMGGAQSGRTAARTSALPSEVSMGLTSRLYYWLRIPEKGKKGVG
eukprot:TRINITY_DN104944_c0_g1_i1.p1 TRINITY_DN104944_c0_g1~~TRINITY_DN104944_c0_g1_i1.p1  ORF type:complete len:110 (+),score=4.28 TRINITY_DN104944_c0_g1_i1:33-332(+)